MLLGYRSVLLLGAPCGSGVRDPNAAVEWSVPTARVSRRSATPSVANWSAILSVPSHRGGGDSAAVRGSTALRTGPGGSRRSADRQLANDQDGALLHHLQGRDLWSTQSLSRRGLGRGRAPLSCKPPVWRDGRHEEPRSCAVADLPRAHGSAVASVPAPTPCTTVISLRSAVMIFATTTPPADGLDMAFAGSPKG